MPGLAEGSSRTDSRRATYVVASTQGNTSGGAAGVPSTCLMAADSGLTIPRLDGVAVAHQLREGEQATARLAVLLFRPASQRSMIGLLRNGIHLNS